MTLRSWSLLLFGALVVAAASDLGRTADFVVNDLWPMARAAIAGTYILAATIKDAGTRTLVEFSMLDRNFHRHMLVWGAILAGAMVLLVDWLVRRRHVIAAAVVRYAKDLRRRVSWLQTLWNVLKAILRWLL